MMDQLTAQQAYDQIAFYTLAHSDPTFIHQYAVDAFAAQFADEHTKPIQVAFALAGLYLHVEKGYTGRAVQLAHMQLAKERKTRPRFPLPPDRGNVTPSDVLRAEPGAERDRAIRAWSASVWGAWKESHSRVADWIHAELGV